MLWIRPALLALLVLVPLSSTSLSAAQSEPQPASPTRLEPPRPPPAAADDASFKLSLAASVRLSALGLGLADLAQGERRRFWPASLQLGVAVGAGIGAVFIDDPGMRAVFSLAALVGTARSIVQFSMHADMAETTRTFAALPAQNKPALFRKLRIGELGLARAARVGKRRRIIDGSLSMMGAAAYVPVQWAFAKQQDSVYRFGTVAGDYVGLSLALIAFVSGLLEAIAESPAELYYREYRALRAATMQLREPQASPR